MRIQPVSISDPLADARATNARALLRRPSSASTASTGKMPPPAVEKTQTEQMQTAPVPAPSAPLPQLPSTQVLSIVHEIQAELQKSFAEQSAGQADETVKQRGPGHGN